jgi:hypothetical protein
LSTCADPLDKPLPEHIIRKHWDRKHGPGAYYGQKSVSRTLLYKPSADGKRSPNILTPSGLLVRGRRFSWRDGLLKGVRFLGYCILFSYFPCPFIESTSACLRTSSIASSVLSGGTYIFAM